MFRSIAIEQDGVERKKEKMELFAIMLNLLNFQI